MIKYKQTTFASAIVILFGIILFYVGTDGFRAYTAESARLYQLMEQNPAFPDVTLEDSNGKIYPISELKDKYLFITFMYTSCGTVCPILEMNMGQVYEQLPEEYIGDEIVFLSISFDIERDDPATLAQYKEHFYQADGKTWRMARIPNEDELSNLLNEFGVIVIPDGTGNFAHNSAFYFVDRNGFLIEVMDYTEIDGAAKTVLEILEREKGE
ncbi:SCO family protein [Evansella tamaricis]|uniref:SCO family protein n=1 Tax=Evansella tamaricis TaxID=2069301 RepID=A0ABS6J9W0_9BACI|nr:SCO family protein [Evansella tamaricis]MBU9710380.1 SCO family protein [Evansella tamaricis]